MLIIACQACGEDFETNRKARKFCSTDCYQIYKLNNPNPNHKLLKGKCKDCNKNISITRTYCSDCYRNFLDKPRKRYKMTDRTTCDKCGILKTEENTFSPEPGVWSTKCRKCCRKISKTSETKIKKECVKYKGGCCKICGYKKSLAALDFHHLNPEEKDFTIASRKNSILDDKMKQELDKCILICSNCHREEHSRLASGEESLLARKSKSKSIEPYVEIC